VKATLTKRRGRHFDEKTGRNARKSRIVDVWTTFYEAAEANASKIGGMRAQRGTRIWGA
jgi:hypothetical protein